jgi:hypothetical protein
MIKKIASGLEEASLHYDFGITNFCPGRMAVGFFKWFLLAMAS